MNKESNHLSNSPKEDGVSERHGPSNLNWQGGYGGVAKDLMAE